MEMEEVLSRIAADRVELVRFEQTDLHGISRSKTVPTRHVAAFAEGGLNFLLGQLGFDAQAGVAPGTAYLEERGFPDSRLFPDPDTYAVLPWADATARLLCNPHFFDGAPAMASPRLAMQRLCDALAEKGYAHLSGYEYKLYLVRASDRRPAVPGRPLVDRRPARPPAGPDRLLRPHRQLRQALQAVVIRAGQRELGAGEPLGRHPRQGPGRGRAPHREPRPLRRIESLPGRRRRHRRGP
jgi:glutamine synthetase